MSGTAGRRGFGVWFTGLPASGKSTVAKRVATGLAKKGIRVQILDSDELREILTPAPSYSETERDWFYEVVAFLGGLLSRNGVNVLFAATAPKRIHRDGARRAIPRFLEVWVRCPLETCMERDPKGIYARGAAGEAQTVPGLQAPFEAPEAPAVTIDTAAGDPADCARQVLEAMEAEGLV